MHRTNLHLRRIICNKTAIQIIVIERPSDKFFNVENIQFEIFPKTAFENFEYMSKKISLFQPQIFID